MKKLLLILFVSCLFFIGCNVKTNFIGFKDNKGRIFGFTNCKLDIETDIGSSFQSDVHVYELTCNNTTEGELYFEISSLEVKEVHIYYVLPKDKKK